MPSLGSVFISYAHADNEGVDRAKRWLDRLQEHLSPLVQQDQLALVSDEDIDLGENWHAFLETSLNQAVAAVLLVSPAFLASKYIRNNELPVLLRNAAERGVKIIPVILRPCLFEDTRFKYPHPLLGPEEFTLASLQAAGSPQRALSEMSEGEQDRALLKVAQTLARLIPRKVSSEPKHPAAQAGTPRAPTGPGSPERPPGDACHAPGELVNGNIEEHSAATGEKTDDVLGRHLQAMLRGISHLPIPGLDQAIPLEAIWTRQTFLLAEKGVTPLSRILGNRTVAFEAPAGFGKTTLSKIIAISLARDFLRQPCADGKSWQGLYLDVAPGQDSHFPILVDLRRLHRFEGPYTLLCEATPMVGATELSHFEPLLVSGAVVFILDGLDELEPDSRSTVFEIVSKARLKWKDCYFILTSRHYAPEALRGSEFCLAKIGALSSSSIEQLIEKWARVIGGERQSAFVSSMERVIAAGKVGRPFVNSPLMVALLASIYIASGSIPEDGARLYSKLAIWLFKSRSAIRERKGIDLSTTRQVLEATAFHFIKDRMYAAATEEVVRSATNLTGVPAHAVEKAIQIEALGANCLLEEGGRLSFWHEFLRDYFAASWLIRQFHLKRREVPVEMDAVLQSSDLRDVVDMLIALLAAEHERDVEILLERTTPAGERSARNIRAAALQSRILKVAEMQGYEFDAQVKRTVGARATSYLSFSEADMRGMDGATRVEVFVALGVLGKDARLYGPPFRRAISLGADAKTRAGKFPVTVQEYGRYLKMLEQDRDLEDAIASHLTELPLNWEQQLDTPNAPVTGVSWVQASHYCTWLTAAMRVDESVKGGLIARLPSREEWCLMAGSVLSRRSFPSERMLAWGTRPVGIFFEQAGVHGHQALSDGVWEWIGPSFAGSRRRKGVMRSSYDAGRHTPLWWRVRGSLQSQLIGFRVMFVSSQASNSNRSAEH